MTRAEMLAFVDRTLSAPPARDHIVRPVSRGEVVARFVLPLELCKPQNRRDGAKPGWVHAKSKGALYAAMRSQCARRATPLPGRPQVIAIRFSSVEPDRYADWAKAAIDILCVGRWHGQGNRLGLLRDDRPKDADVHQHWEPARQGEGFVYIEVRASVDSPLSVG